MKINNIFIISDLEGAHSIKRFSQTRRQGPELERSRNIHTEQVNSLIRGIRSFNAAIGIHLWDSHGCGGINRQCLDTVESFLPPGRIHLLDYFKLNNIDALFFESAHAMSNTHNANLCHTMSSRTISKYFLNGAEIGEIGLRAAVAGSVNIPVLYLNGDDKACEEARAIMPWIITTETKKSIGLQNALDYPRDKVLEAIRLDAQQALLIVEKMLPYVVSPPITLLIRRKWHLAFYRFITTLVTTERKKRNRFESPDITTLVDRGVL